MKAAFLVSFLATSIAFASNKPAMVCVPTTESPTSFINYIDEATGLNRVEKIDIYAGKPGTGGYGVKLVLSGTSGKGDDRATSTVELPWTMSHSGAVNIYSNWQSPATKADPFIKFEIEENEKSDDRALGALTVVYKTSSGVAVINSRYNCVSK